jgi:hypothetical protein
VPSSKVDSGGSPMLDARTENPCVASSTLALTTHEAVNLKGFAAFLFVEPPG